VLWSVSVSFVLTVDVRNFGGNRYIVVKFLIRDSFLALWICLVAIDLTDLKQNSVTGDADSLWFFVRELQYRGTERSQCVLWRWPTCEMVTFYVTIILGCCLCRYCVQYILYTKRKLLFPADLVSLWTLNLIPLWSVVSSCSAIWAQKTNQWQRYVKLIRTALVERKIDSYLQFAWFATLTPPGTVYNQHTIFMDLIEFSTRAATSQLRRIESDVFRLREWGRKK